VKRPLTAGYTARSVIVYLRKLSPGEVLDLSYRLRAVMPVKVTVRPAEAYEYYDPQKKVASAAVRFTATEGTAGTSGGG